LKVMNSTMGRRPAMAARLRERKKKRHGTGLYG